MEPLSTAWLWLLVLGLPVARTDETGDPQVMKALQHWPLHLRCSCDPSLRHERTPSRTEGTAVQQRPRCRARVVHRRVSLSGTGARDRRAIIAALREGRIDVLATDHAPHTLEEKSQAYELAPSGLPLVQFALQCALERYFDGDLSLELIIDKTAHAPAMLFQVHERGFIREGYHADLTLIDLNTPQIVRREDVLSKCGWSPFEGQTFRSSIAATWVNGQLAYHEGQLQNISCGQRLEFNR